MKSQKLFFAALLIFFISKTTYSQIPNYVPTNGLVGWWPFNGDANDESGNGNNGTVNGAILEPDRFGNTNQAYGFNGTTDLITFPQNFSFHETGDASISIWINSDLPTSGVQGTFLKSSTASPDIDRFNFFVNPVSGSNLKLNVDYRESSSTIHILNIDTIPLNTWQNIVLVRTGNSYLL